MLQFQPFRALIVLMAALVLSACGGGGGGGASSSLSPSTVYAGPISGFGSVIVNGVRFDTVGSSMVDDDGNEITREDLRLGMTVTVKGDADDSTLRGTATQLSLTHGTSGVISTIDKDNDTLTLLGQTVTTDPATAYQGVAAFDSLNVGDLIEVYGVIQADGSLLATLIEKKSVINAIRLMGRMTGLDPQTSTFMVGTLVVDYGSANVTGTLAEGKLVKIKAGAGALSGNVLTAESVKVAEGAALGVPVAAGAYLKIKGVADSAPVNGVLTVSGVPVDVSKAVLDGGVAIAAGQYMEVKGTWSGTILEATKVEFEGYDSDRNELYGPVTSVTTVGSQTLAVINGVTVDVSLATFEHGSLAGLLPGSYVEIKGFVQGDILIATRIELKNGGEAQGYVYEAYGLISDFVSVANFKVNGLVVDASAAKFEDGTAASLANNVYVEIKGAQNASGVFIATKVEIKTMRQDG